MASTIEYNIEKLNIHYFNQNRIDFLEKEITFINNQEKLKIKNINKNGNARMNVSQVQNINNDHNYNNNNFNETSHINNSGGERQNKQKNLNNLNLNDNVEEINDPKENNFNNINSKNDLKDNKNSEMKNLNIFNDSRIRIENEKAFESPKEQYKLVIFVGLLSQNLNCLNKTLEGISQSISDLEKAGFPIDKILVLVIQDGKDFLSSDINENLTKGFIQENEILIDNHMHEIFEKISNENIIINNNNIKDSELRNSNAKSIVSNNNFSNGKSGENNKNMNVNYNDAHQDDILESDNKNARNIINNQNYQNNLNCNNDNINENQAITLNKDKYKTEENLNSHISRVNKNNSSSNLNIKPNLGLENKKNNESSFIFDSNHYLISFSLKCKCDDLNINNIQENKNLNILFCIKNQAEGFIDNFYYLFFGFCKNINPEFLIFLEAGTIPTNKNSLVNLITPMQNNFDIIATCGETNKHDETKFLNIFDSARGLDLKYLQVINKDFESLFGFVFEFSKKFSAIHWQVLFNIYSQGSPAVLNQANNKEFAERKGINKSNKNNHISNDNNKNINVKENHLRDFFINYYKQRNTNCEVANRYFAFEKIFSHFLFSQQNENFIVKYIPDAVSTILVAESFDSLLIKSINEINSNFFAFFNVVINFGKLCKTKHKIRRIFILIYLLYSLLEGALSFFILATFYFYYYIIFIKIINNKITLSTGEVIAQQRAETSFIMAFYLVLILLTIAYSLVYKPKNLINNLLMKNSNSLKNINNVSNISNSTQSIIMNKNPKQANNIPFYNKLSFLSILSFVFALFNIIAIICGLITIFKTNPLVTALENSSTTAETNTSASPNVQLETWRNYQGVIFLFSVSIIKLIFPVIYEPSMILMFLRNFLQYIFFQPVNELIFRIYAITNLDFTHQYGGLTENNFYSNNINLIKHNKYSLRSKETKKQEFNKFKIKCVFIWLVANFFYGWGLSFCVTETSNDLNFINSYSIIIGFVVLFKVFFAFIGKMEYLIYEKKVKNLLAINQNKNNPIRILDDLENENNNNLIKKENKNFDSAMNPNNAKNENVKHNNIDQERAINDLEKQNKKMINDADIIIEQEKNKKESSFFKDKMLQEPLEQMQKMENSYDSVENKNFAKQQKNNHRRDNKNNKYDMKMMGGEHINEIIQEEYDKNSNYNDNLDKHKKNIKDINKNLNDINLDFDIEKNYPLDGYSENNNNKPKHEKIIKDYHKVNKNESNNYMSNDNFIQSKKEDKIDGNNVEINDDWDDEFDADV